MISLWEHLSPAATSKEKEGEVEVDQNKPGIFARRKLRDPDETPSCASNSSRPPTSPTSPQGSPPSSPPRKILRREVKHDGRNAPSSSSSSADKPATSSSTSNPSSKAVKEGSSKEHKGEHATCWEDRAIFGSDVGEETEEEKAEELEMRFVDPIWAGNVWESACGESLADKMNKKSYTFNEIFQF